MMRHLISFLSICLSFTSIGYAVPCLDPMACNFMEEGACYFTDENGEQCIVEGCTIEGACNYDPEADIFDGSCEFVSCLGCTDSEACNYDETALYDNATCNYYIDCHGICGGDWVEDACGNCFDAQQVGDLITLSFSSCGASGPEGPTQYDCDYFYGEGVVSVVNGIQKWIVPQTGIYQFEAGGAKGGGINGGKGALASGSVELIAGTELNIVVGQRGGVSNQCDGDSGLDGGDCCGGGGGATALYLLGESLPLMVLAGGGGQAENALGGHGNIGTEATLGGGTGSGVGGIGGQGGEGGQDVFEFSTGGGGAGWYTNGQDGLSIRNPQGKGGKTFSEGCNGGLYTHPDFSGADGGFGGGGGASDNTGAGGGGGGYNGGGGGNNYINGVWGSGGGGGSFIAESVVIVSSESDANENDGFLNISWVESASPFCNPGCTYPQACNFNPESNFDDGSCDYCFCGEGTQWVESLQTCVVTEAALMQGCGAGTFWDDYTQSCLPIETCQEDLDGNGVIGVNDLLLVLSYFGSECTLEPDPGEWSCGDYVHFHGYEYATTLIGGQCWFAENLRSEYYSNGDIIGTPINDDEWSNTDQGMFTVGPRTSLLGLHELHYNWHSAIDPRGVCPTGWGLPTLADAQSLVSIGSLEEAVHPLYGGNDSSGFSGVFVGKRDHTGSWQNQSTHHYFYTSSLSDLYDWPYHVELHMIDGGAFQLSENSPNCGYSIRCVKEND